MRMSFFFIGLLSAVATSACFAGQRHFDFLYEAPTSPAGSVEIENWISWERTTDGGETDQLSFRHELEFGLTERLQASLYLADWSYSRAPRGSGLDFSDAAVEFIYNFTNPATDPIGLSAYQELRAGDRLIEWESRLIAQKNFGRLIFAYNATLEATWQGSDLNRQAGEFQQAFGTSFEISPRLSVGIELLHEFAFPEWNSDRRTANFFAGPDISYRRQTWFVTVAALAQGTDTPDEPDFQVRAILGIGL